MIFFICPVLISSDRNQQSVFQLQGSEVLLEQKSSSFGDPSKTNPSKTLLGKVSHILVDTRGWLQYLVIELTATPLTRQVLLPAEQVAIDRQDNRVYAIGLTQQDMEHLPELG